MNQQAALVRVIEAAKAQLEDIRSGIEANLYDPKENDVIGLEAAITLIELEAGTGAVSPAIVLVTTQDGILNTAHDGQVTIEVIDFDTAAGLDTRLLPEAYRELVTTVFDDPHHHGIRYQGENTKLELVYCDAASCQVSECVVVAGAISNDQLALIAGKLQQGGLLIAQQVGLPTPSLQLQGTSGWPSEIDHVFTCLEAFESGAPQLSAILTLDEPTHDITIHELVARFSAVSAWDVDAEWNRLKSLV
ncbi:MAG: hypothetical protein INH12_00575 [Cupriavidus sp.]|jgi:hypothetical protein|uniref:hypothetical protein n=1 Tax=Cupriavidus sp. TaxID=1873897 RepID=UPI0025C4EC76|nr:hypothetical protein [Cupriavidus sp.]MCA3188566.1 hypothetical protein [Cupriavidus sp.]MCA3235184.1 hypothetical protein [Cupriavidus sp.]MCA3774244.1 hypothetical protein [Cutibacterium sp.]